MTKPYIICVDDDKSILISLKAQLNHYLGNDFNFEFAECAEEAWEVIDDLKSENKTISVIISDWIMPRIKGDEFLINVHQKHPEIVKLMLTGHAEENAIKRATKDANLVACLGKPWDIEELINIIRTNVS
ncbi:MAG: DNA-binding NtrC family response regulator [Oleiphilaceae bacterium]|jgi:DNA-binding NtrC family response regulator